MLQRYLFLEAMPRPGAVAWILDDDVVLEGLGYGPDSSLQVQDADYASAIKRLKQTGAAVVLCQVTGDPPLPFLSCVRTQLVDLYHNLHRLARLPPDASYRNLADENRLSRMGRRDYYYDLSGTDTAHLEMPFWYDPEPAEGGECLSIGQVFEKMVARLPGILSGVQLFRPLVQAESPEPVERASLSSMPLSVNRGPATLVFDVQALRDFPNTVPAVAGSDTRRSDMVWSLLNRFAAGREVAQSPLPVRQVREAAANAAPDFDTLAQDIRGYALYSSLRDILDRKAKSRLSSGQALYGREFLDFGDDEIKTAVGLYRKYLGERSLAFELSFLRIMGLLSALRRFCWRDPADGPAPWWLDSPEFASSAACPELAEGLRDFVETLESIYTDTRLEGFRQRIADTDTGAIERFLGNLPEIVARHRAGTPLPADALRRAAEAHVRAEFDTGALSCLGIGEEGVVLTGGAWFTNTFTIGTRATGSVKSPFSNPWPESCRDTGRCPTFRKCGETATAWLPSTRMRTARNTKAAISTGC